MAIQAIIPIVIGYAKLFPPDKYPYMWGVGGYIYKAVVEKYPEAKEKWHEILQQAGAVTKVLSAVSHKSPYSVVVMRNGREEQVGIYDTIERAMEVAEAMKRDWSVRVIVVADEGRQEIVYEWSREAKVRAW